MATITQLNRKIAHTGVECFKGNGYFYFIEVGDHVPFEHVPPSVYTMSFNTLTLAQWVAHVEDHITAAKGN